MQNRWHAVSLLKVTYFTQFYSFNYLKRNTKYAKNNFIILLYIEITYLHGIYNIP